MEKTIDYYMNPPYTIELQRNPVVLAAQQEQLLADARQLLRDLQQHEYCLGC